MSLRTLYQAIHVEVMFSRSARVWIGPVRNGEPSRTHSVLYSPIVVSQSGVVQGVADGPDRRDQPFQHQCLAVMYCGVLTSGVRMRDRVVERVALAGAVGRGVAQRALDEAGVLGQ